MPSADLGVRRARRRLTGALVRAHQRFSLNALTQLHPDVAGEQFAAALDHEQRVDGVYLARMIARADRGAAWALDPAYDRAQQSERLSRVAAQERRYLRQHMDAAARRMGIEAKLARMRALGEREGYWQGGRGPQSCKRCRAMGGRVWPLAVLEAIGPQTSHHGCFAAGTVTSGPAVHSATKRWYAGELVDIVFASGDKLAVTPNHPVLTPRGWVGAGFLDKGDHVIGGPAAQRLLIGHRPGDAHVPTRIEDVVEAMRGAVDMDPVAVPTTSEHFHGDGGGSEVHVVWADRALQHATDTTLDPCEPCALELALVREAGLAGEGSPAQLTPAHGSDAVLAGLVGGPDQRLSFAGTHIAPTLGLGGAAVPLLEASALQADADGQSGDAQIARDLLHALARLEAGNDLLGVELLRREPAPEGSAFAAHAGIEGALVHAEPIDEIRDARVGFVGPDHLVEDVLWDPWGRGSTAPRAGTMGQSALVQAAIERALIGSEAAHERLDGFVAGVVGTDQVVELGRREFRGHVYNLETAEGWYIANGIVVHNCQCTVLTKSEARAQGLRLVRGTTPVEEPNPPWARGTVQMAEADDELDAAVREAVTGVGDGLSAEGAGLLAEVLREAIVPRWRSELHPRWPKGHPLGGEFRPATPGAIPGPLRAAFERLKAAAAAGDIDDLDAAHGEMVSTARRLRDPAERAAALRSAYQARAAILNPAGANVPMGASIEVAPGVRRAIPLPLHHEGVHGSWSERGTFQWEIGPGDLGPGQGELLRRLERDKGWVVAGAGDRVRVESALHLRPEQANMRARQLELVLPQLRAMRTEAPGLDLVDPRPLDIDPEEGERPRRRSAYPLVSSEQIGQAGESVVDAVAQRLAALQVIGDGNDADWLSGASKQVPLDWRLGHLGVEVKTVAMRRLVPGVAQKAPNIELSEAASKTAYAQAHGLTPALATIIADLDQDRAHVFLHEYPPDAPYGSPRVPVELIDRLLAGELRPGEQLAGTHSMRSGQAARAHLFVGSFRLGYNPLGHAGVEMSPGAARTRARPADVGASGPVVPAPEPERVVDLQRGLAQQNIADRAARDEQILAMARGGTSQVDIAAQMGLTQGRVSQILKQLGHVRPVKQLRPKGPTRNAQEREARGHFSAGLSVAQIAKKMDVTQDRVRQLLGDDAPPEPKGRRRFSLRGRA